MNRTARLSDRRRLPRDTPDGEPERSRLASLILGTYREMPGLYLHVNQAARLFGLRPETCRVVLEDLVHQGRLRHSADGQYAAAALDVRLPRPVPADTDAHLRSLRRFG